MGPTHPTQLSNIPDSDERTNGARVRRHSHPLGLSEGEGSGPSDSAASTGQRAGTKAGRGAEATPLTMHSTSQGAVGQNGTKTAEPEGCAPGTAL